MLKYLSSDATNAFGLKEGEGDKCNGRTRGRVKGSRETCRKIRKCITNAFQRRICFQRRKLYARSLQEKKLYPVFRLTNTVFVLYYICFYFGWSSVLIVHSCGLY